MVIRGYTFGYLAIVAIALVAYFLPVPDNTRGDAFFALALLCTPAVLVLYPVWLLVKRHPSPIGQIVQTVRTHWRKLLWTIVIYSSLAICLETFSAIKKSIPYNIWFYADPFLIDLDRAIFFGADAWQVTHAILGWTTPVQVWLYAIWHFLHIGLAIVICFTLDEAQRIRFALLMQFIWLVLGGFLATISSSVGPIMVGEYYGDSSFDPLLRTLEQTAPSQLVIRDRLVAAIDEPNLISGISAMPSIHVAIAVCLALFVQHYRIRPLTILAWSYVGTTYIGSMHLGWHYATDGLVSAPLVIAAWWALGRLVGWLGTTQITLGRAEGPQPQAV